MIPRTPVVENSVALTRLGREIKLELACHAIHFLGFRQGVALDGDIRPDRRIFRIQLQPLVETRLSVGLDRFGRTFRFAHTTIDAFVRIDSEEIFTLVKAVDRADFNAIGVFAADAIVGHDICHDELQNMQAGSVGFGTQAVARNSDRAILQVR